MPELDQTDAFGRELPSFACPDCGYGVDAATNPFDPDSRPEPGDVSVCFNCTAFLQFDQTMRLVILSSKELRELPREVRDVLHRLRRITHEVRRNDV